jgi:hypothetical protein
VVAENHTAPTLATVPGVEIASVGYWNISNADDWHPSAEELASAVAALDCPAVRRPTLKFGHTGVPGEGDPSIGLVDDLRLTDDGQTLVGDFVGVPGWLASADDEGRSVIASAYPDRSGEFQRDYVCQLGHVHPFVVHAVALLGVVRPGIGTLESLYDLYAKAPAIEEITVANAPIALAGTTTDEVRKAYYNGPAASNWALWIREMYVEPAELIVQDDSTDSLLRVPYTLGADGSIEFGDGQPVKVEYISARAAGETPVLAFASRAEARTALAHQSPSAAQAEVTEGKEGAMPTLKEGLAQKLGISADADDETTLKALDEALSERADEGAGPGSVVADEPSAEQLVAAAAKAGMVLVDRAQFDQTVQAAQQGATAFQNQVREGDKALVEAAIKDGKFPPVQRDHYLGLLEVDRARTTTLIDQMAKGFVPLAEAGHAVAAGGNGLTADDDLGWFDTAPAEPATERKDG